MITAGIDLGAKTIKVVVMEDGEVLSRVKVFSGFDQEITSAQAFQEALKRAGVETTSGIYVIATGMGRRWAPFAQATVTEVTAAARGILGRDSEVRTVIDVGAEEGRAILITPEGKVKDFVVNEKCAAGAGTFVESMARALEVTIDQFGQISLTSQNAVPMNAQCAVFAESEVVSLLHARTPKPDIARAVLDAIASRIVSMARRISITPKVALIGGLALNQGFIESLKRTLEMEVIVPEHPEYIPAEGAALVGLDRAEGRYEPEEVSTEQGIVRIESFNSQL